MEFSGDRVWCPPVFMLKLALHELRLVRLQNVPALYNLWETFCCIRAHCTNISGLICCCFKFQGRFWDRSLRPWPQNWAISSSPGTGVLWHSWDCLLLLGTPSVCSQQQSRWFPVQSCPCWNPWHCEELRQPLGSKEKSPWSLHLISFSNYFRQFLSGTF